MISIYKPNYASKVLIVDGAHALRRAIYQPNYRELSNSTGMPTGAIYGVCRILCSLKDNFAANSIVVSLEGGHSERRKSIYEDYKKRDGVDEVDRTTGMTDFQYYLHQQSWTRKLLESLGIHVVSVQGKEGDDVIFQLVHLIDGEKIIVSEDKDFYTLVSKDISVYRPIKGQLVGLDTFEEVSGYKSPIHYLYSKVLLGDGSDNIPAICKGVGEKTISDILSSIDSSDLSYKKICEVADTFKPARYKKVATMDQKVFNRNLDLIDISREIFTIPELMSIVENIRADTKDLSIAMKLMKILEFGEATRSGLLSLSEQCSMYPLDTVISKDYLRSVMEGTSVSILGGN